MQQYVSRGTTIDTEQCVENIGGNRYNLVIIASARAREIAQQNRHSVQHAHWHTPVTALLEVQNGELDLSDIKRIR
jgi:DNA-directed RNA polymerase omega subunit